MASAHTWKFFRAGGFHQVQLDSGVGRRTQAGLRCRQVRRYLRCHRRYPGVRGQRHPSLKLWQIPLAVIGLMLAISLPSMALAWFKLKKRNLGPILHACGWAINARALINIPFGTALTGLPHLPAGAQRALFDPYAEKKPLWPYLLGAVLLMAALVWAWYAGYFA